MSTGTCEVAELPSNFTDPIVSASNMTQQDNKPNVNNIMPEAIIFGSNGLGSAVELIPKTLLQKLPKETMDQINELGQPATLAMGGLLALGATEHYEPLIRVKQYLANGTYPPDAGELTYVAPDGSIRSWTPKDQTIALKVTPDVDKLLSNEIDVYLFAYSVRYKELREFSAERISSGFYPKSLEGIFDLISRVYARAVKVNDLKLANKIIALLNANYRTLPQINGYGQYMRRLIHSQCPVFQLMIQQYIDHFEACQKSEIGSNLVAQSTAVPPSNRSPPKQPRMHSLEAGNLQILSNMSDLVKDGKVYIARRDGYGTRLSAESKEQGRERPADRNCDFSFKSGDLLLVDNAIRSFSAHNTIVTNLQGEKGSVLGSILVRVPPGFGLMDSGKIPCAFEPFSGVHR